MNSGPGKCATTAVSELAKSYCYGTRGKILESNDIQSSIPRIFFFNYEKHKCFNYCDYHVAIHSSLSPGDQFDAHEYLTLFLNYLIEKIPSE